MVTFVGVDVSKATLDVCILGTSCFQVGNDEDGISSLVLKLVELDCLVVMEYTGGHQMPLASALAVAKVRVALVNPRAARDFAGALGQMAKTDKVDSKVLAMFGERIRPTPTDLPDEGQQKLVALVVRRRQLVENRVAEQNRKFLAPAAVQSSLTAHITMLNQMIKEIDAEIAKLIRNSPIWKKRHDILESVSGVGKVTIGCLMAMLPELGTLNRKKIASLVGVASFNKDSGKKKGKRSCFGGRAPVRAALYMATLVATQHEPVIAAHYEQLVKRGKEKKVALVACMRKLLTILNAMVRDGTTWRAELAQPH
jgi:transposase